MYSFPFFPSFFFFVGFYRISLCALGPTPGNGAHRWDVNKDREKTAVGLVGTGGERGRQCLPLLRAARRPLAKLGHEGGVCPMPLRGPQS